MSDELERAKAIEDYEAVARIKAELAGAPVEVVEDAPKKRSRKDPVEKAVDA